MTVIKERSKGKCCGGIRQHTCTPALLRSQLIPARPFALFLGSEWNRTESFCDLRCRPPMDFSVLLLLLPLLLSLAFLSPSTPASASASTPLNCSDFTRLCTSFIAIRSTRSLTLPLLQSMFDVLPPDLTLDDPARPTYVYVRKNCSCSAATGTYLTTTTLTVREGGGRNLSASDAVAHAYGPLAFFPKTSRIVRSGAVVTVRLVCGCSSGLWNYLVSYVVEEGDNVEILASRFGASMDSIESVNGISDPDDVVVGDVLYIPIDSVPGEPYPSTAQVSPAPSPAPISASSTLLGASSL